MERPASALSSGDQETVNRSRRTKFQGSERPSYGTKTQRASPANTTTQTLLQSVHDSTPWMNASGSSRPSFESHFQARRATAVASAKYSTMRPTACPTEADAPTEGETRCPSTATHAPTGEAISHPEQ